MQFLRKSAVAAAASLLVLLLFGFGFAWSLHRVLGTSSNIKGALRSSGIYQSVVGEILDHAQKDQNGVNSTGNVPVSQPDIRQIIEKAFPPSFLQTQTEQVLDASYAWANGKTSQLQFTIDLTGAKQQLADGLQQYVTARLATLPVCTANTMPTGEIDPYNATCVPPGFDKNAAAAKVKSDILAGNFLKDTTITPNTIKDSNGKTLSQQLKSAPSGFHRTTQSLYLSGLLALLLAAAVVALSSPWRAGARKVSTIAIVVGGVSLLLAWAATSVVQRVATKVANNTNIDQQLQAQITSIVKSLIDDVCKWWAIYGLVLAAVGAVALVALYCTRPKSPAPAAPAAPASDGKKDGDELQDDAAGAVFQTDVPIAPKPTPAKRRPPHLVN